ncbi:MAG: GAF domain-containing protein [Clostridia bacterium]|nr:GAF domain-containing protein [Clostridia bacterium]
MNEMNVNLKALLDKEDWLITSLSNASALLNEYLDNINWVGFYLMQNGELVLGPFQGKSACVRIKVGRGVCGTAVSEDKTQLVPDVHQFPGHIACDSASNSEIVVPIHHNGEVVAVLDIDSPLFDRFTEEDKVALEESVKIIEEIWK